MENGYYVRYSVKELIESVSKQISNLDEKLDQKADKSDMVHLGKRLSTLEEHVTTFKGVSEYKKYLIGTIGVLIASGGIELLFILGKR